MCIRDRVFSCFACGGGSTMGYKIAGYDVIGCNEIDPRMMKCYETNHHPPVSYTHLDVYKRQLISFSEGSICPDGVFANKPSPVYSLSLIHI